MSRFTYCLRVVLGNEGGFVDHKSDRGGATNYGVTQKTYDDFCKMTGRPTGPVKAISMEDVETIYGAYWKDAKCSYMPEPLDLIVFDAAINHGAKRAVKFLQRALGIGDDGIAGNQTLTALHEDVVASGIEQVCLEYLKQREAFFDRIVASDPSQAVFSKGWLARVDHMRGFV